MMLDAQESFIPALSHENAVSAIKKNVINGSSLANDVRYEKSRTCSADDSPPYSCVDREGCDLTYFAALTTAQATRAMKTSSMSSKNNPLPQ